MECSLTFKEAQEAMLRSELQRSFHEQSTCRSDPSEFFHAIERSLYRVRRLKSEKIIIVFCRRLTDYSNNRQRKGVHFSDIGPEIAELLRESGIEHCKICIVGSEGDKVEDVRSFFGLERVNELAWRGCNEGDNVVYVMGAGLRSDLDRVLGEKDMQTAPDNHIFLL